MSDTSIPGLLTDDVRLTVPLDHFDDSDPRTIEIYARLVSTRHNQDKPWLVFLQGGPGCESPRPTLVDPGFPAGCVVPWTTTASSCSTSAAPGCRRQ